MYFERLGMIDNLIIGNGIEKNEKTIIPITLSEEFQKILYKYKRFHNFSSVLEPRYSTSLIEQEWKDYLEIEFELSGDVEIKEIFYATDKEQYVFIIKGKTKQSSDTETIKETKDPEFQLIINRFIPLRDKEKKEYEIIILKEDYKISFDDEFGIHNIKVHIRKITKSNDDSFVNSESD